MQGLLVAALGPEWVAGLARSLVSEDPLLVAGGVAGILVIVVASWYAVRWYRRPAAARLSRLLSRTEAVTILMHPNPDPDAMAAAVGVAHLAERVGTEPTITYAGEIRHPENRAFRTVFGLDLEPIEQASDIEDESIVLVDHNEPRGFVGCEGLSPTAIIDHHPENGVSASFTDVRPDYGACASIVAEYFEELGMEPDRGTEDDDADALPSSIATGLLFGILADTDHLTSGTIAADYAASAFLSTGIDNDALNRISNPDIDAESLDVKARAITDRRVNGPFVISHVGEVSNADAIPPAADELLQMEGITAVIVSGQKDNTIHLSGRSRDDRIHMGNILEEALDDIPMSGGGGHAQMGGGQISVDHMEGIGPSDGISMDELQERLFSRLSGET